MEDKLYNFRIQPAERLSSVQEYYFSVKLKEVARMNAEGKDIISLAIGSPDMPPLTPNHRNAVRRSPTCRRTRLPTHDGYSRTAPGDGRFL